MRLNSYCWFFSLSIGMVLSVGPLLACTIAQSSGQHYVVVGLADDGKKVQIDPSQVLLVCLPTQATGYRWNVSKYDSAFWTPSELGKEQLRQLDAEGVLHFVPEHGFPGATGRSVFEFKPLAQGATRISLHYERSWDKQNPAKTFAVTVSIVRHD